MTNNEKIIQQFYAAFQKRDAASMITHYAPNIHFNDPAFGDLHGTDAKNMWQMLCENGTDLHVEFSILGSSQNSVKAQWIATYTFSKTKRSVRNEVTATFTLQEGKIIKHIDQFNLWKWSKQALGFSGFLLGWSSFFQKKLHQQTHETLRKWQSKH